MFSLIVSRLNFNGHFEEKMDEMFYQQNDVLMSCYFPLKKHDFFDENIPAFYDRAY